MEMSTCLLLDDLARNCIDEQRLEQEFAAAIRSMSHAERDELPAYLFEAMAALYPVELISYERVCGYVSDRVRRAKFTHIETELQALIRKIREALR